MTKKTEFRIKEVFIAAQERLPIMVGPKYSNVVVSCLSCLDRDNQGFGDESKFQDSGSRLRCRSFVVAPPSRPEDSITVLTYLLRRQFM